MRILFLSNRVAALRESVSQKFSLPERFKGTVVEKWANYWRGLVSDYTEVAVGVVREARNKPKKALVLGTITYGLCSAYSRNPDVETLMSCLRYWNNEMSLVPGQLRNPESVEYLTELEQAVNQHRIRTISLGVLTLLWLDKFDEDDCTYGAVCDYTRVRYWNLPQQIVDVGFWNQFWRLRWKMNNYDVNYL